MVVTASPLLHPSVLPQLLKTFSLDSCKLYNDVYLAEIPLSFTVLLQDVTVEKEEQVTLQCELSKPNQKVTWLKNGKALSFKEKNRYKISADGTKHTLIIPKADAEDATEFTCSLNGLKTQGKVTVKGSSISDSSHFEIYPS